MKQKLLKLSNFIFLSLVMIIPIQVFSQMNTPAGATKPFATNAGYEYGLLPTNLSNGDCEIITEYNNWKTNYVENCGSNMARVKFDEPWATVSEGIAYGMLLSAYAADQDLFNRLWAYYKNFRNSNGVMHWKINGCNSVIGFNGATDAELDAAMALLVANHQWPNTTSPHNYVNDGIALINAIKNTEVAGDGTFYNGDMWHPDCRNPSYQSPAYARAFKKFMADNGNNQNTFWDNVATKTEALFAANAHPTSGLNTNWSTPAGPPSSSCWGSGTEPDKFGYDACRAPWRQAVDILWYGPTTASSVQTVVDRAINFWITKGAANVQGSNSMNHDGTGSGDKNCAFWGPVGAQSLAASNTVAHQTFCNEMLTQNLNNSGAGGYFTKILQVIGLFVQSGNFWNPYATTSASVTSKTTTASACDSYTWALNNQTYTNSGTFTALNGCSTETLVLTINNCTTINCTLIDVAQNTTITGNPISNTSIAFISLTKLENNVETLIQTKPHSLGNVIFDNVIEGNYRLILHNNTNPTTVPAPSVPNGYSAFKFEGFLNSTGDNNPNGIIEISLPTGQVIPNAKIYTGTLNVGFGLQSSIPLPVKLISFEAKNTTDGNLLIWKTSSETDFSHFEIERSKDSKTFEKIGNEKGTNQKNEILDYRFLDLNNKLNAYYRLKLVDIDGKATLSNVIFVTFEKGANFISVENPANNGEFKVVTNLKNPKFTLLNAIGMAVNASIYGSGNQFTVKVNNATAGIYYLNIVSNGKLVTKKVLIP